MFNWVQNLFRYEANSRKEFIYVAEKKGCGKAVIEPYYYVSLGGSKTETIGTIINFQYMLEFRAMTPRGRKIVYYEHLFECFATNRESANNISRRNAVIQLFLFGEQGAKELQEKIPGLSVDVIGPDGRPMDDAMYDLLHRDAETYGISIST